MDTCSVKTYPVGLMERLLPATASILGTHPMFGPDSARNGVADLPMILCPVRIAARELERWRAFFASLGLSVSVMTPDEHDREAAFTQGVAHYIGRVLSDLGIQRSPIGTVGYNKLLEIVEQTCNDPSSSSSTCRDSTRTPGRCGHGWRSPSASVMAAIDGDCRWRTHRRLTGPRADRLSEPRMESPMAEVRIKDIDEHEIDTILAEDIDFEGHLTFKKPLMIKGKFKGEIKSTSSLYIGEKAYVEATTEAAIVSSKGTHKGDIVGHSRVELFSTAQVEGDITTPDFVVESGCKFNGYCNMGGGLPQKDGATPCRGAGCSSRRRASPEDRSSSPGATAGRPAGPPRARSHGQPQNPSKASRSSTTRVSRVRSSRAARRSRTSRAPSRTSSKGRPAPSQGSGGQQR